MFALLICLASVEMGYVGTKTRSQGQILEKPCICCRGPILCSILLNFSENVCFDDFLVSLKMGHIE